MQKRSWPVALAAVALIATAMALYVQLFEQRALREEARRSAARLEEALAQSRSRARALEQRRAELAKETGGPADQPLPGAVLRRGESGSALQQVRDFQDEHAAALTRLQESLDTLALQMEQADQALRRDLDQIRTEVRREREATNKTLTLLLAALIPLVVHLLLSFRPLGDRPRGAE
jgi:hypothetical protein